MTTEVNLSNTRRKIRSLLAKTTASSNCTPDEKTSAMKMALDIADKHITNKSDVIFDEIITAQATVVEEDILTRAASATYSPTESDSPDLAAAKVAERKSRVKKATTAPKPPKTKRGDHIIAMLSRKEGVSIAELQKEFGSQPHTVRAQISVSSRQAGFKPILVGGRYYRTAPPKE